MYQRETAAQKATREKQLAESQARMANYERQLAQHRQEQAAKDAEHQAFLERVEANRAKFAAGESVLPEGMPASPLEAMNALYKEKAAQEEAAALAARKAARDAAKAELANGAANTPGYILANLPPGDPLRKAAMLRQVNPEDFE